MRKEERSKRERKGKKGRRRGREKRRSGEEGRERERERERERGGGKRKRGRERGRNGRRERGFRKGERKKQIFYREGPESCLKLAVGDSDFISSHTKYLRGPLSCRRTCEADERLSLNFGIPFPAFQSPRSYGTRQNTK